MAQAFHIFGPHGRQLQLILLALNEMIDHFPDRQDGVHQISVTLLTGFGGDKDVYSGT